jgi:hypothetical protein
LPLQVVPFKTDAVHLLTFIGIRMNVLVGMRFYIKKTPRTFSCWLLGRAYGLRKFAYAYPIKESSAGCDKVRLTA